VRWVRALGILAVLSGLAASSAITSATSIESGNAGQLAVATPGRPVITMVVGGDRLLTVSFEPPADTGNTSTWEYSTDSGTTWRLRTDGGGAAGPLTITRQSGVDQQLDNGVTYAVAIRTVDGGRAGLPSNVVAGTPAGGPQPPGAPRDVVAWASFQAAVVDWNPPGTDGGSAVTTYTAVATPGGMSCSVAAPATRCTIAGLANGGTYDVTVSATNAAGTSLPSQPPTNVSPRPLPGEPFGVVAGAGPGPGRVAVSWIPPETNQGAPVRSFVVSTTSGVEVCTVTAPATGCAVTGLPSGGTVSFVVRAVNSTGAGPPSLSSPPLVVP